MTSVHSHLEDISHRGWMPVWLSKLTESALAAQVLAAFEKFAPMFEIISLNSLLMCSLWRSHGTVSIDEAAPGQLMREQLETAASVPQVRTLSSFQNGSGAS